MELLRFRGLVSMRGTAPFVRSFHLQASRGAVPFNVAYRYNSTAASTPRFTGDVTLEKFLTRQLMDARKAKDTFRTNVLRTVIGELQTEQKVMSYKGTTPEKLEESAMKNVRKAVTKRKAAAQEYRSSNLPDAASHEEQEASFLDSLLPKQLSKEDIQTAVERAYIAAKEDGSLSTEGGMDVQTALRVVSEKLEAENGKGVFSKGDVAGVVMPLLQKDGLVKGGKKKAE